MVKRNGDDDGEMYWQNDDDDGDDLDDGDDDDNGDGEADWQHCRQRVWSLASHAVMHAMMILISMTMMIFCILWPVTLLLAKVDFGDDDDGDDYDDGQSW